MFKGGASWGGVESMKGNTHDTRRWKKGRGGVHNTHAHIVPGIERKSKAHAPSHFERKLFTNASAEL